MLPRDVLVGAQLPPVEVTLQQGPTLADWSAVALTAVLVLVTVFYAKRTSDMAQEMKLGREQDIANRRREKSERAAYACLIAVRSLSDEMFRRGPSAVDPNAVKSASDLLNGEGALIDDPDVRDKLGACANVLFVGGYNNEVMDREGLDPGVVALRAHEIVRATRSVLERYLSEHPQSPDPWGTGEDRLPNRAEARAWVYNLARRS